MEEVTQLTSENAALKSENQSLKDLIEQLDAQCKAFDQTTVEVLKANISLKAGVALTEKRQERLMAEIKGLNEVIATLRANLAAYESPEEFITVTD